MWFCSKIQKFVAVPLEIGGLFLQGAEVELKAGGVGTGQVSGLDLGYTDTAERLGNIFNQIFFVLGNFT